MRKEDFYKYLLVNEFYFTADLAAGLGAAAISGNSRHQAVRGQDEHLGERAVQV